MGFISSLLEIIGFGVGIPIGLLLGFFLFIFFEPRNAKGSNIRTLHELDSSCLLDVLPAIPFWVKCPDHDRVDWLNKFISDMWPFLDKALCQMIRSMADSVFAKYMSKYRIISTDFESLSLGTNPPEIHGVKVQESNENELVLEPAVRWAGNPDIKLVLKLFSLPITIQLMDLQIFAAPRIVLKPLVPSFPCFATVILSLMEKPHVDFGLKFLGGDIMAIPWLYQYVQETIRKQVASLYLWPQTLELPILDSAVATKRPVGILNVKVIRACKLLKMDLLGASDPYVELRLSGEKLLAKKTSVQRKNLNPEWNEDFQLLVKDLQSQALHLHVYDWEKVKMHDKLGMQVVSLRELSPRQTKIFTLDLVKNTNPVDHKNRRQRGQLVVELMYKPFKEDTEGSSGHLDQYMSNDNKIATSYREPSLCSAGLLLVMIQGAKDVEGKHHTNPYALVLFRGEQKKTKMLKKTRDPCWNEEFEFLVDKAPLKEKIHIEVMTQKRGLHFRKKESLGHVDISLRDVVYNERINEKYGLINSRNGVLHVEMRWRVI